MALKKKKIIEKEKIKKDDKIIVYDLNGESKKEISIPEKIKNEKINLKLLAQAVRVYLVNQRQGTVSTKTRGEVTGSTRKIYRQKGTGRARHGDIKAPIFVGGGVVGGPKPKKYQIKLNKKQIKKTLITSFILKLKEKKVFCLDESFLKIEPKTKLLTIFFKKVNLEGKLLLIVDKAKQNNLVLAARNLNNVFIETTDSLTIYKILNCETLLFTEESLTSFLKKINED